MRPAPLLPALSLSLCLAAGWACSEAPAPGPAARPAPLSVAAALGGDSQGFLRATAPGELSFPADHGPHPGYRSEWWYFTGNLATAGDAAGSGGEGRRFGFQLTFFRHQLAPSPPARASAWATAEVYMAHFAVADLAAGRFHACERFARGALGLAGAEPGGPGQPFRVWLEGWRAEGEAGGGIPPLRLRAGDGEVALQLELSPGKPLVLHGKGGLSPKGPEPGNASYYYSLTRLAAAGTLTVEGEVFPVTGLAWMDREWSTSALSPGQVGWDWFSLQLADGRDLMLYQLRREDGGADPASSGTLVAADGSSRPLAAGDFAITPRGRWTSPASGVTYPTAWRIEVPGEDLDLEVAAAIPNQELDLSFRYWEGAVIVGGQAGRQGIAGRGYAELTGYDREP